MATALNHARNPQIVGTVLPVAALFQSAGYQKRTFIRLFVRLAAWLGADLPFARHVARALGLKLAALPEERPEIAGLVNAMLKNRRFCGGLSVGRMMTYRRRFATIPSRAKMAFLVASRLGLEK